MKRLLLTMIAMITLLAADCAWAQKKTPVPSWPLTFEGVVPGDTPAGWARAWGDQGDDLVLVSNERAASGVNSMLLDRRNSTNESQWGLATKIPAVRSGWGVLSFCMLAQGAGTDLMLGYELRDATSNRASTVTIGVSKMRIHLAAQGVKKQVPIADLRVDAWQRVTVWLPTVEGRQTQVWAKVENLTDGEWKPAGELVAIDIQAPSEPMETFMIATWPKKRDYKLFLDDLRLDSRTSAPR